MFPTDLDARLRRALALPREPVAFEEAMGSVVSGLPRYRARRRAVRATGAAVLGVLGLVLGLLVAGVQAKPTTTAAPGRPTCVEVQVGTVPASCIGRVTHETGALPAGPAARLGKEAKAFGALQPQLPTSTGTIRAAAGERIVVSLPHISGVSWVGVMLADLVPNGEHGSAHRSVKTHLERATGRTVAVVPHATRGGFALVATGLTSCTNGRACVPTTDQWSITVNVR